MSNPGRGATPDHRRQTAHGSGPRRAAGRPAAPPVTVIDWLMLVLAAVSVVLLSWITFWDAPDRWVDRVVVADYLICGVFLVEFCWRWSRSGLGWRFPVHYWYEILGMVPLSDPAFRSFRLIRVVVILARLARVADRTFGDRAAAYMVAKFADTIVGVIRRPVTVAVLDEVIAVVQTGNYTTHIASAVEENRAELDTMILELVRADPVAGRLRRAPFHDDIVRLVSDTVLRIMDGALTDHRVHELISDAIRESATELRANVRSRMTDQVKQDAEKFGS